MDTLRLMGEICRTPVRMAGSVAAGWTGYLVRARARRLRPLDAARDAKRLWHAHTARREPLWAHPNRIRAQWPLAWLRDYSIQSTERVVPTLVLPAHSGQASSIVDYSSGRSQMMTIRSAGLTDLHCLEWRVPVPETVDARVEDYLDVIAESVELLGGRVNLVGNSQGGWLAAIFAALHPERVHTLTIGGAPVDFHAGLPPLIRVYTTAPGKAVIGPLAWLSVTSGRGRHRGAAQVWGVKLLDPAWGVERLMRLWAHIDDPEFVDRHVELNTWLEWPQDLPGKYYLWAVRHLFLDNELVDGKLVIGGRRVDLAAITCPLFLLAGNRDHSAPPVQVWALGEHASTPVEMITRREADAGHLQLFTSGTVLTAHWLPLMRAIRELSVVGPG